MLVGNGRAFFPTTFSRNLADNLQRQRYEHKYIIRENVALSLRDFVSSYLELDSFGAIRPNAVTRLFERTSITIETIVGMTTSELTKERE